VVVAIAAMLVLVATTLQVDGHLDLGAGGARLLLLVGAVALGDLVRTRRSLSAEARGRAARDARERESEHLRRLSDERLRIARDVHDSIAHALVAINVRAGVAAHLGEAGDGHAALVEIKDVSSEALADLRATLGLLRREHDVVPTAPALGLEALPQLLERTRSAGLAASSELAALDVAIPSPVGQAGFRIVQESLTNVLRHADARSASVRVQIRDGALEIDVEDDGRAVSDPVAGHGVRGMAERADALGGQLVAGPRAEGGWRVHALLPLAIDDG
jgi:signal transduction histidine kinase